MAHVYLGLGTNLGDKEINLVTARDLLMKHDVLVIGQSEVRETEPLGDHPEQPMYLNQVIECQTELSPEELVVACKKVEKEMGRETEIPMIGNVSFGQDSPVKASNPDDWTSRIIDIDVLFYDQFIVETPIVLIPHPRLHERDFVLEGMCDLNANFVHPVLKKTMKELLDAS